VQDFGAKPGAVKDLIVIIVAAAAVFAFSAQYDIFNKIVEWTYRHETWRLDELFTVAIFWFLPSPSTRGAGIANFWRKYIGERWLNGERSTYSSS
jgi:hypothetical protein